MRLVITFFLSLVFLLLGGTNHLHARTNDHRTCYALPQRSVKSELARMHVVKYSPPIIRKSTFSGAAHQKIKATEVKEEDESESESSRKLVAISNYFISLLYDQVFGHFHRYLKDSIPFCKHFSYTSSYKYIIQRVIRI